MMSGITRNKKTEPEGTVHRRGRNEYTTDEDKLLIKYIGRYNPGKEGRHGNNLYKTLVENAQGKWSWAERHTWSSWRERYKCHSDWFDTKILAWQKKNDIEVPAEGSRPRAATKPKSRRMPAVIVEKERDETASESGSAVMEEEEDSENGSAAKEEEEDSASEYAASKMPVPAAGPSKRNREEEFGDRAYKSPPRPADGKTKRKRQSEGGDGPTPKRRVQKATPDRSWRKKNHRNPPLSRHRKSAVTEAAPADAALGTVENAIELSDDAMEDAALLSASDDTADADVAEGHLARRRAKGKERDRGKSPSPLPPEAGPRVIKKTPSQSTPSQSPAPTDCGIDLDIRNDAEMSFDLEAVLDAMPAALKPHARDILPDEETMGFSDGIFEAVEPYEEELEALVPPPSDDYQNEVFEADDDESVREEEVEIEEAQVEDTDPSDADETITTRVSVTAAEAADVLTVLFPEDGSTSAPSQKASQVQRRASPQLQLHPSKDIPSPFLRSAVPPPSSNQSQKGRLYPDLSQLPSPIPRPSSTDPSFPGSYLASSTPRPSAPGPHPDDVPARSQTLVLPSQVTLAAEVEAMLRAPKGKGREKNVKVSQEPTPPTSNVVTEHEIDVGPHLGIPRGGTKHKSTLPMSDDEEEEETIDVDSSPSQSPAERVSLLPAPATRAPQPNDISAEASDDGDDEDAFTDLAGSSPVPGTRAIREPPRFEEGPYVNALTDERGRGRLSRGGARSAGVPAPLDDVHALSDRNDEDAIMGGVRGPRPDPDWPPRRGARFRRPAPPPTAPVIAQRPLQVPNDRLEVPHHPFSQPTQAQGRADGRVLDQISQAAMVEEHHAFSQPTQVVERAARHAHAGPSHLHNLEPRTSVVASLMDELSEDDEELHHPFSQPTQRPAIAYNARESNGAVALQELQEPEDEDSTAAHPFSQVSPPRVAHRSDGFVDARRQLAMQMIIDDWDDHSQAVESGEREDSLSGGSSRALEPGGVKEVDGSVTKHDLPYSFSQPPLPKIGPEPSAKPGAIEASPVDAAAADWASAAHPFSQLSPTRTQDPRRHETTRGDILQEFVLPQLMDEEIDLSSRDATVPRAQTATNPDHFHRASPTGPFRPPPEPFKPPPLHLHSGSPTESPALEDESRSPTRDKSKGQATEEVRRKTFAGFKPHTSMSSDGAPRTGASRLEALRSLPHVRMSLPNLRNHSLTSRTLSLEATTNVKPLQIDIDPDVSRVAANGKLSNEDRTLALQIGIHFLAEKMSDNHGFRKDVVMRMLEHTGDLRKTDENLRQMREAAQTAANNILTQDSESEDDDQSENAAEVEPGTGPRPSRSTAAGSQSRHPSRRSSVGPSLVSHEYGLVYTPAEVEPADLTMHTPPPISRAYQHIRTMMHFPDDDAGPRGSMAVMSPDEGNSWEGVNSSASTSSSIPAVQADDDDNDDDDDDHFDYSTQPAESSHDEAESEVYIPDVDPEEKMDIDDLGEGSSSLTNDGQSGNSTPHRGTFAPASSTSPAEQAHESQRENSFSDQPEAPNGQDISQRPPVRSVRKSLVSFFGL